MRRHLRLQPHKWSASLITIYSADRWRSGARCGGRASLVHPLGTRIASLSNRNDGPPLQKVNLATLRRKCSFEDGGVAYVVWARSSSLGFLAVEPSREEVDYSPALPSSLDLGLTWYQSRQRQTAAVRVDILLMRRDLLFYWHDACNQSPTAYEEYHRMSEQTIDRTT